MAQLDHQPNRPPHVSLPYRLPRLEPDEALRRADAFLALMATRRSCRFFSDRPVDRALLLRCIATASTAPSGANRQPWMFVIVDDPSLKREIRAAAEREERASYDHRMPAEWLEALHPIGTDWRKPYLETAPFLVVLFRVDWEMVGPRRRRSYYPAESVGIAAGLFLAACHNAGLATLTHTPSPMAFLRDILRRPAGERPFLLIPVGYPAADAVVPDLPRKTLAQVTRFNRGETPDATD